jgi:hypothetical protein
MDSIEITFDPKDLTLDVGDIRSLQRQTLGEIGAMLVASIHQGFQDERAPDGSRWTPNSPVTIARKGHGRVLFETGRLIGSIQVVSLDSQEVKVGPATPDEQRKAVKHQFEGVVPSGGGRPIKRPMLGISEYRRDAEKANEIAEKFFGDAVR